jgi:hypothetical protein
MKIFVTLSFLIFIRIVSYAQYTVYGIVIDQNNSPLKNVSVSLYSVKDTLEFVNGIHTNVNGEWKFENIHTGDYQINFVLLGFEKQFCKVTVADKNIHVDTIKMQMSHESLDEIIITANLLKITAAKETRLFSATERERAATGLELITNVPQLFLNSIANKLTTIDGKSILILCDGKIIDEIDLMALHPDEIVKVEYFSRPPARYQNIGVESVLHVITRRSKEKGGYLMTNLKSGFTTGYGTDIINGKLSSGNNDYSLRYFVDYRDLDKNHYSQSYGAELNGNNYQIDRQEKDNDYKGEYHVITGSFLNTKTDEHLFSVRANLSINPGMEYVRQNVVGVINNTPVHNEQSDIYTKTKYVSPNLDLYYSRKIDSAQELFVNVVGTYYYTKSDRTLSQFTDSEKMYEMKSDIRSKSNSLISEISYSKTFGKYNLNTGSRFFHKKTGEDYRLNINPITHTNNAMNILYVYAELNGEINKFSFNAGIGGEQSWFDIALSNKKTYFVLKPTLTLAYRLNDNSSFRYFSLITSNVPNMSLLSENAAYFDSAFISHGNSNLKPYYTFINGLSYTFNKSGYYLNTGLYHFYMHNPYYTAFYNRDTYLEKTYFHIDNQTALKYDFLFNWRPANWISARYYSAVEYQQSHEQDFSRYYWFYVLRVSASIYYKAFSLNLQMNKQNASLEGSLLRTIQDYYGGTVAWKKGNLNLSLGCIFSNSPEIIETYKTTDIYYRDRKTWGNFKGLTYVQLIYNLPFGKNIRRSMNQRLNNADDDSGIYIDNKAKQ